jgi:ABC-type uncharacterized transport system permease subunit
MLCYGNNFTIYTFYFLASSGTRRCQQQYWKWFLAHLSDAHAKTKTPSIMDLFLLIMFLIYTNMKTLTQIWVGLCRPSFNPLSFKLIDFNRYLIILNSFTSFEKYCNKSASPWVDFSSLTQAIERLLVLIQWACIMKNLCWFHTHHNLHLEVLETIFWWYTTTLAT